MNVVLKLYRVYALTAEHGMKDRNHYMREIIGEPLSTWFIRLEDARDFQGHCAESCRIKEELVSVLSGPEDRVTLLANMLMAPEEDWSLFRMFWNNR